MARQAESAVQARARAAAEEKEREERRGRLKAQQEKTRLAKEKADREKAALEAERARREAAGAEARSRLASGQLSGRAAAARAPSPSVPSLGAVTDDEAEQSLSLSAAESSGGSGW